MITTLLTGVLREADSVTYGVNCKSSVNKLDDFDVSNGQLPQDMMHIMLEGVIPYTIKAMLQSFMCEKHFFTIDCVNQKFLSFKFSQSQSRNGPSQFLPTFYKMMVTFINQVWFVQYKYFVGTFFLYI